MNDQIVSRQLISEQADAAAQRTVMTGVREENPYQPQDSDAGILEGQLRALAARTQRTGCAGERVMLIKAVVVLLFVVLVFALIVGLLWYGNRAGDALEWEDEPWH